MSKRDYYETLGVAKTADAKTMKSAFRKKAMECHPDPVSYTHLTLPTILLV